MNLSFLGNRLWKWVCGNQSPSEWDGGNGDKCSRGDGWGYSDVSPTYGSQGSSLPRSKHMLQWWDNIRQSFVQEFINAFWVFSTRSDPGNNLLGASRQGTRWVTRQGVRETCQDALKPRDLYVHWVGREAGQGSPGSGSQGHCPGKGWSDPMCRSKTPPQ